MYGLMRVVLVGVLMTPALAFAQTSFPRCTDRTPANDEGNTVTWPHGGNGCRETLPEPPPPGIDSVVDTDQVKSVTPEDVPPIWLDFDPKQVPGFDGTIDVGLDIRALPSVFVTDSDRAERPLVLLEYALQSPSTDRVATYDVISLQPIYDANELRLVVEHRRSSGQIWSGLNLDAPSTLVNQHVISFQQPFYWDSTARVLITRVADDLLQMTFSDAQTMLFPLAFPSMQPVRVRRGMFGRPSIRSDDTLNTYWFQPHFPFLGGQSAKE